MEIWGCQCCRHVIKSYLSYVKVANHLMPILHIFFTFER